MSAADTCPVAVTVIGVEPVRAPLFRHPNRAGPLLPAAVLPGDLAGALAEAVGEAWAERFGGALGGSPAGAHAGRHPNLFGAAEGHHASPLAACGAS